MSPSDAEGRPGSGPEGWVKRGLDLGLGLPILVLALPVMAGTALVLFLREGWPLVHASPRAGLGMRPFTCWKFRTMETRGAPESGVSGADKDSRITPLGRRLRRSRLDELPQLFNVLAGSMALVGPRPPDPAYAARYAGLYREILQIRPGLTGLATVMFHLHEEAILREGTCADQTDRLYVRRCIPRKARLDRIYRENWTPGLDLYVLYLTAGRFLPLPGAQVARLRARAARLRDP